MFPSNHKEKHVVIIGAGPAGLTAAHQLGDRGTSCEVIEKDDAVGGLCRTVHHNGYHFDIGGHRFFTKVKVVETFWHRILPPEEFLTCQRMSRIYYNKKFFHYPLRLTNAILGLGIWNCFLIMVSYLKAQFFPIANEDTFDLWVSNRFGKRLYETFFRSYTEKVWGIPCSEISADWASQRIKGLSLFTAIKDALIQKKVRPGDSKDAVIKTLIDSFEYPKRGPGQMWEAVAKDVLDNGDTISMNTETRKINWVTMPGATIQKKVYRVTGVEVQAPEGVKTIKGTDFITTMPIRQLLRQMSPEVPADALRAAESLEYRDFLTVALIIDQEEIFPDNWIYIHDPEVQVGRIQNFKNWSQHMVPDQKKSCLGLEYFCFEGDGLWTMSDKDLIAQGARELDELGLSESSNVIDGVVVRMPKAYPVYDGNYKEALRTIRDFLDSFTNLYLVGRNGMHRYNNQDHSMLTAMLAVKNIHGANYDLWSVNDDDHYHEEVRESEGDSLQKDLWTLSSTQPRVPKHILVAEEFSLPKAVGKEKITSSETI